MRSPAQRPSPSTTSRCRARPTRGRRSRPSAVAGRGGARRATRSRSASIPFQAIGKALIRGDYEGFVKVVADKKTDELLGVHMIGADVTDLISEASRGDAARGHRLGGRRSGPPAPNAVRGARRGRPRGRRQVDQLLRYAADGHEDAHQDRGATPASPQALGADLGLSRDELVEMYRLMAFARAVDERMWILNRAGKIPFVISGQGHEGAQVGIAYRRCARATTGWCRTTGAWRR